MGPEVPDHRAELAAGLGARHPVLRLPAGCVRIIYTTNAIESLNMQLRKIIKTRGHFPSDEAAIKLLWLALRHITRNWKRPPPAWHAARPQLAIQFGERFGLRAIDQPNRLAHRISDSPARTHHPDRPLPFAYAHRM